MALKTGNKECSVGLSKRIFETRLKHATEIGINTKNTNPIKADCYAIACAIVDEIIENAEIEEIEEVNETEKRSKLRIR